MIGNPLITYDSNGNIIDQNLQQTYDVENHVTTETIDISSTSHPTWYYDASEKRVVEIETLANGNKQWTLYAYIFGKVYATLSGDSYSIGVPTHNAYFGDRLIQSNGTWVVTDRLGSVRANSNGETSSYLPYGEERTPTANARVKFGTYFRDSTTYNQDYADQRYYNPWFGRFNTPDPSGSRAASPANPNSWNMYAYGGGDPINNSDPSGLDYADGSGCGSGYFSGYLGCGGYTGGLPNQAAFGYSWAACGSYAWMGSYQFNMPGCGDPVSEAQMSYFAMVQTTFTVQSGTGVANGILGQNGGANPCGSMFNLPQGVTVSSLASHVAFQFSDLGDSSLYAQTFEPNEQGNPYAGQYTIIFNTGVGNPNLTDGPVGAANTLIHELLHVASILYGPGAVPAGWSDNDGGDDDVSKANQARNQAIVNANCFPKGTP